MWKGSECGGQVSCDIKSRIPGRPFKVVGEKASQAKLSVYSRVCNPNESRVNNLFR